jgi:GDP-4-dehydro-6-deoxy-D-mannose reductase
VRALITGGTGFAGGHLAAACERAGDEVVRVSRSGDLAVDLVDGDAVRRAVASVRPEVVYHLAAQAHVGRSWEDPASTLAGNIAMTANVLEAGRTEAPDATVVAVASGEVYGPPASLPVDEQAELAPHNPYAVSKAASDLLARMYALARDLRVVRARAFNHAGPGQEEIYAISSFARQFAVALESGTSPVRVVTGNPDTRRDFTDVRDVARAYRLLAEHGEPGEAYNICTGGRVSVAELLRMLAEVTGGEVDHVVDPSLVRSNEVMEIRGVYDKLRDATGWRPEIPLETTLADTVAWWRERL